MRIISKNMERMPRSGIRVIMDLATARGQAFHLELGEPGFQTPEHIARAAEQAIRKAGPSIPPTPACPRCGRPSWKSWARTTR